MVSKPRINCANKTNKIIMSEVLDVARMRGLVMRRLINMIKPIKQRMPKTPPETIASNCLFSVLIA